ncbi:MAG TPA: hypothetical protein VNI61_11075 [Gemmatimonadales bacterium]|nr:hypothetical protein [Gemmatimonadales bacterium]
MRPAVLAACAAGLLVWPAARRGDQSVPYRVVVHVSNPVSELARDQVSQLFLRRRRAWPDGRPVLPVDLPPTSPVRQSFTRDVHRRSVAAVISYWRQQIYLRRGHPPPEVPSDREVLAFLRANTNAVGYVSAGADLGTDIKVVIVRP